MNPSASKQADNERNLEGALPPVRAFSLYGGLSPLLLFPALVAPAIALFAPAAERVNDFAAPGVMKLRCRAAVVGRCWSSPLVAG